MFTFSEDYMVKSMLGMIEDESKRIASLGLATNDEVNDFATPVVKKAFSDAKGDKDMLLEALAVLHDELRSIKLPGDLDVAAGTKEQKMMSLMPAQKEQEAPEGTQEESGLEGDQGKNKEDEEEDAIGEPGGYEVVYSSLRDVAYKLASKGDHSGAYSVERIINELDALISSGNKEELNATVAKLKEVLAAPEDEAGEEGPRPFDEGAQEAPIKPSFEDTIGVNEFAKRHTPESKYSHFDGSWEQLVQVVKQNLNNIKPSEDQKKNVWLVSVPPDGFYTGMRELVSGEEISGITGKFAPRKEGENPYMQLKYPAGEKVPAKAVEVVLFHRDTLGNDRTTDADWEIISINASPWFSESGESEPINPEALMRNYFDEPGGTPMEGVTPEQFVEMLKKSRDYWRNKIMLG